MLLGRITQDGPPLPPAVQVLRYPGHVAPLGDQTADRETPVGRAIIHDPVVALPRGEWLDDGGQMRGDVLTGAWLAPIPDDVSGSNDAGGDACPHAMPDVLVLAFCRLARGHGRGGILALQHLPTSLFITA